ncbi:MAG: GNAT family N-acetyltransferase [Clostridia bacterium]|nr:GNAT family N-acetyltransferase [Clostridia bacterium]
MNESRICELKLHIPTVEELWFYQSMLSDPATMSYNAKWFPPDGCIPFPKEEWEEWHGDWIGNAPQRFYAYVERISDGAFVGGVNYQYNKEADAWEIGVLITASERGGGYGKKALELLVKRAFETDGAARLVNFFEPERRAALRMHLECGFTETSSEDGLVHLLLTREEYFGNRS